MPDRQALALVGWLFAAVTVAVMLTAALTVKNHADGRYSLEGAAAVEATAR